jgi:hypothetical protein
LKSTKHKKEDGMGKVDKDKQSGRYPLGGSKDADLEGIDETLYDVYTDEEKLAKANKDFPKYVWFTSFTIKDKSGKIVEKMPEYVLKFDRPVSGNIYYYLNGQVFQLTPDNAEDKGKRKRVKVKLTVGDPPVGVG